MCLGDFFLRLPSEHCFYIFVARPLTELQRVLIHVHHLAVKPKPLILWKFIECYNIMIPLAAILWFEGCALKEYQFNSK